MKRTLPLLFLFFAFYNITVCGTSNITYGFYVSPNIDLVYGANFKTKFWIFPDAIGLKAKTLNLKKQIIPGISLGAIANFRFSGKRKDINHNISIGLGYRLLNSTIEWSGIYSNQETFRLINSFQRHDLQIFLLYGLSYKNLSFKSGLAFLAPFYIKDRYSYSSSSYYQEGKSGIKEGYNRYLNLSIPFSISYTFLVKKWCYIEPEIKYSIGILDYNSYDMKNRNIPVLTIGRNDQLEIGVNFLFKQKMKK